MKKWKIEDHANIDTNNTEDVTRYLLEAKGIFGQKNQEKFLNPKLKDLKDPLRIPDMEKAVRRLELALKRNEHILLFSDYDVDGMSSGALLFRFISSLGGSCQVFIPERVSEGYGLSIDALKHAFEKGKPSLLIALDCGTTSHKEIEWLKQNQIDVIIIDHHELQDPKPVADAFVNPQRGNNEEDYFLATVGLVFKFCHAFLKLQNNPDLFDLKLHMDFVALGTISDLVPLLNDNRILVRYGIDCLAETRHVGLRALMDVARIRKSPTTATVGFMLGPRLNASGRLAKAKRGWELLSTFEPRRAMDLAKDLDDLNRERQRLELRALKEAEEQLEAQPESSKKYCVVVGQENWHQGVVGIVASRIQKKYYRPTIVVSFDENGLGKGSGRCIEGASLMDAFRSCAEHLETFGGHAMAAGLEIEKGKMDDLRHALNKWFHENVSPELFRETLTVDLNLSTQALTRELADSITLLEPFGQKNKAPLIAVHGMRILGEPRIFSERHLRFQAEGDGKMIDVVGFGLVEGGIPQDQFDMVGFWELDSFTNRPCFRIIDWKW